jgi:hypothetical protein
MTPSDTKPIYDDKTVDYLNTKAVDENTSDGYHTFKELYEFRRVYNTVLFNEWARLGLYDVHKSRKHSDGLAPFDKDNWFIVVAELPTGQISNHYTTEYWDSFKIPEKPTSNTFDGHTPQDVLTRLEDLL